MLSKWFCDRGCYESRHLPGRLKVRLVPVPKGRLNSASALSQEKRSFAITWGPDNGGKPERVASELRRFFAC
jgi:hypothetical protein